MKKLLTALVVLVYSVPASIFLIIYLIEAQKTEASPSALIIPLLLMITVCAMATANIVGSVISVMHLRPLPFKAVMVSKLCLIPFYIVNFACWAFASMVFHIALVIWPLIPFIIGYTYLTLLGTSAHAIANLFILRRNNSITSKYFCIYFILQLTFAADVIDSVYLAAKQGRRSAII